MCGCQLAREIAKERSPVQAVRAEPLGDGEHDLPVRYARQQRLFKPARSRREALRVTWGEALVVDHRQLAEPRIHETEQRRGAQAIPPRAHEMSCRFSSR
jgi:hypothetical protein